MKLDRNILNFWTDKDLKVQAAHILDQCEIVLKREILQVTPFLSEAMSNWLEGLLKKLAIDFKAVGGFEYPERVRYVLGLLDDELSTSQSEVSLLQVIPLDPKIILEHRQVLGSLIGLGLKREVIGDILPGENGVYVAVNTEITPYLLAHWDKVGNEKVEVTIPTTGPNLVLDKGEERRITVSSSRIDAIAAGGFGVSRSFMQELISQGKVKRNDLVLFKPEQEVKPGDLISCRGQGRLRLLETSGVTRKGRIAWKVQVFKAKR